MLENLNYKKSLDGFVNALKGSFVEKLIFDEDLEPTFDKNSLPFKFKYCFSLVFVTDKGNFLVHTSQTNLGIDTFWIEPDDSVNKITSEQFINSKVKKVTTGYLDNDSAYKLFVELENGSLIIYAAEIYDDVQKKYTIKINDEMVLVFGDEREARKFEASKN